MRRLATVVVAVLVVLVGLFPATPALASEPVNGGGSTWSFVAIQQWQSDIARQGFTVNYQSVGSTAGRQGFYNNQYDFAVSEIPFQPKYCSNPADPTSCNDELALVHRPFTYMPIVAGGTSILYNLQINGQSFRNLRLSPRTLAEVFTGKIKNWNAADIAADNPGVPFPNLAITPVVRSDGSGTSYQFTAFMAAEAPDLWNGFCASQRIPTPCPPTSQFPAVGGFASQNGSDGVANFVEAPYNNGSIGYAEAAYGIERNVPLASLKNASGAFVQPSAVAVAVALTSAVINADHTQNLAGVYANPDARAYPMSSYSYAIIPTWNPSTHQPVAPMDASKGATLGQFILYFLCQGQQEAAPLGYSPLPPNLVQLGFSVEQQIAGGPAPPALAKCNNPTITGNFLGKNNIGAPVVVGGSNPGTTVAAAAAAKAASTAAAAAAANAAANAASSAKAAQATSATSAPGSADPGQNSTDQTTGATNPAEQAAAVLAAGQSRPFGTPWRPMSSPLALLVGLVVLGLVLVPPGASMLKRRRADRPGTR